MRFRVLCGLVLAGVLVATSAAAEPVDPTKAVVILVNADVPASVALGEYYARKRGIPPAQICRLQTGTGEVVSWPDFRSQILEPVKAFLATRPEVLYLVPTWGVPVKTSEEKTVNDGQGDANDTIAKFVTGRDFCCIDRELELLKQPHEVEGWIQSPLFQANRPITLADNVYLVSRLDGPTPEDARALVDNALYGETYGIDGTALVDTRGLKDGGYFQPDEAMRQICEVFIKRGVLYHHDDKPEVVRLGTHERPGHYWGWYTGDMVASPEFRFVRGAVGAHLHSFSAGVLRSPDKTWTGPLVARGVTGTCGTVYEPLASGFPYGVIFLDRFLSGYDFGQAMEASNMFTSWMAVFVGDPLYSPYGEGRAEAQKRNVELASSAPGRLEAALDAGDLKAAQQEAEGLAALPVPIEGGVDFSFALRELRARSTATKPATGTLAALRALVDELSREPDAKKKLAIARRGQAMSENNLECNLAIGEALLAEANPRGAAEAFGRARTLEPGSGPALYGLGLAHRDLKDLNEARTQLQAAWDAGHGAAGRPLGEVLVALGKPQEALAALMPLLERNPQDRGIALMVAEQHAGLKAFDPWIAVLEKVCDQAPARPEDVEAYCSVWDSLLKAYKGKGTKDKTDLIQKRVAGFAARRKAAYGKAKATPVEQAILKAVDAKKADPLPALLTYEEPSSGLPTLYTCNRGDWDVEILLGGPLVAKQSFRSVKGSTKLKTEVLPLWPGTYTVLVTAKRGSETKSLLGTVTLDSGKDYSLAFNKDLSLYRADKP